jgi:hypothetical protein
MLFGAEETHHPLAPAVVESDPRAWAFLSFQAELPGDYWQFLLNFKDTVKKIINDQ